jgi:hypothetical protein
MLRQRGSGSGAGLPGADYYANGGGGGAGYGGNGYAGGGGGEGGGGSSSSNGGGYEGYSNGSYGGYGGDVYASTVYGGNGSSSRSSSDNKYSKRSSSTNPLLLLACCIGLGVWSVLSVGLWMSARSNYNGILDVLQVHSSEAALEVVDQWKQSVEDAQREQTQSQRDATRKYASQINQLERDNRFLAKERDELRVKYEGPDKQEEETRMVLREEAFQSQVELLQQATRKESKRTVLERYVEG